LLWGTATPEKTASIQSWAWRASAAGRRVDIKSEAGARLALFSERAETTVVISIFHAQVPFTFKNFSPPAEG
jgi:hypothetical protein